MSIVATTIASILANGTTTECPHHKAMRLNKTLNATGSAMAGHDHAMHMKMMDHGAHSSEHNLHDGMMMNFHGGYKEIILFEFWQTETIAVFLLSCLVLFVVAALYEGLKLIRERVARADQARRRQMLGSRTCHCDSSNNTTNGESKKILSDTTNRDGSGEENVIIIDGGKSAAHSCCNKNPTSAPTTHSSYIIRLLNKTHLLQSFLHMAQLTISYLLMLVFMTYNSWLCLAVVLGSGMGYFLFGLKRLSPIDVNEHCH